MNFKTVNVSIDDRGVATLMLNRPEKHNALNVELVRELTEATEQLNADEKVRVIILTGAGESFCAGGDLKWMEDAMALSRSGQMADSARLAKMLRTLNESTKPIIGRINGQAYGGGAGMMSVCDITIAAKSGRFALTEVRLGLVPANISPFVVAKMGQANARRTFLNARPLSAQKAKDVGLVDEVVADDQLDTAVEKEVSYFLQCGPEAIAATKNLIFYVDSHDIQTNLQYTSNLLVDIWDSEEGQEGIHCFFANKTPSWRTA